MGLPNDFEEDIAPVKPKPGRKPGQRKRTQAEIIRDRKRIMELKLLFRYTNPAISLEINKFYEEEPEEQYDYKNKLIRRPTISIEQVKTEIEIANKLSEEDMIEDIASERKAAIKRYEHFAAYCLERHERTLKDIVKKKTETRETSGEKESTTEITGEYNEQREGNTKYLDLYERCLWRIAELKAIIPPKKVAPTNPGGTEPFKFEGGEEDRRLLAVIEELGINVAELIKV